MGIKLSSNFELNTRLPLDNRTRVPDIDSRDALPDIQRYDGLYTYVVDEQVTYQLQGGVTNDDWVLISYKISEQPGNSITQLDDGIYAPSIVLDGVVSGGVVTWLEDYKYNISAAVYYINGIPYQSPSVDVTLVSSDPTLDRIDVFIVTTDSIGTVLTGTPSMSPASPSVDITSQIQLGIALVSASSTSPNPSIDQTYIYREGTESTMATSFPSTAKVASTHLPIAGTYSMEYINDTGGHTITLTPFSPLTLSDYTAFMFKVNTDGVAWPVQRAIWIEFYNGTTRLGVINIRDGQYGFDSSIATTQNMAVALNAFNRIALTPNSTLTSIRMFMFMPGGGTVSLRIDEMRMQKAISIPPTEPTLTLTTVGSSGPATYVNGTLNIPNYAGGGGGSLTDVTATNNTGQTWTITGSTIKNLSLALTKNAVGLDQVDNYSYVTMNSLAGTLSNKILVNPRFETTSVDGQVWTANGNLGNGYWQTLPDSGGGNQDLQSVTSFGNVTTQSIFAGGLDLSGGSADAISYIQILGEIRLNLNGGSYATIIKPDNSISATYTLYTPNSNVDRFIPISVNGEFADVDGNITLVGGGGTPNLQQVLTEGNTAELGLTIQRPATDAKIQLADSDDDPYIIVQGADLDIYTRTHGGNITFKLGDVGTTILGIQPATQTNNIKLPNAGGNLVLSVNGEVADEFGNVEITGGGGGSYTFENGITEDTGTVKLGGAITEDTVISTNNNTLRIESDGTNFSPALTIAGTDTVGLFVEGNNGTAATFQSNGTALRADSNGDNGFGAWISANNNPALYLTQDASSDSDNAAILRIARYPNGPVDYDFGTYISFNLGADTSSGATTSNIGYYITDPTPGSYSTKFFIENTLNNSTTTVLSFDGAGKLSLPLYGQGNIVGTPVNVLGVDASGDVYEGPNAYFNVSTTDITSTTTLSNINSNIVTRKVNATGGNIIITVNAFFEGQIYNFKRVDVTVNTVTIQLSSGTIDGTASVTLAIAPNNLQIQFLSSTEAIIL